MNGLDTSKKIIITALLMLLGVCLGFIHAKSLGVNLFEEKVHTVAIENEGDIADMGRSFHNNICTLESDIVVANLSALATSEFPFVGVFDGQGHTITFTGEVGNSLFGYIGKGGVVKNLNIEVSSCEFNSKIGAILALENEGTIINCRVTVSNVMLSSSGSYAAVVAHNKGVIKNVYANASFKNSAETSAKKSFVGGIAAYNYGEINASISEVRYNNFEETVADNVFNGVALNTSMGALVGVNNGGMVKNCAVVIEKTAYVADKNLVFVAASDERQKVFNEEMLYTTLAFDENRWVFKNSTFMLIEGEENEYSK